MKKGLWVLLAVIMALIYITPASAATDENTEIMELYEFFVPSDPDEGVILKKYLGSEEHVIIPKTYNGRTVTEIDSCAFYKNKTLRSVEIHEDVTCIGFYVFADTSNLTKISVNPNNQRYASDGRFLYYKDTHRIISYTCGDKTETVYLPSYATSLAQGALWGGRNMKTLVTNKELEYIHYDNFIACSNLTKIYVVNEKTNLWHSLCRQDNLNIDLYYNGQYEYMFPNEARKFIFHPYIEGMEKFPDSATSSLRQNASSDDSPQASVAVAASSPGKKPIQTSSNPIQTGTKTESYASEESIIEYSSTSKSKPQYIKNLANNEQNNAEQKKRNPVAALILLLAVIVIAGGVAVTIVLIKKEKALHK